MHAALLRWSDTGAAHRGEVRSVAHLPQDVRETGRGLLTITARVDLSRAPRSSSQHEQDSKQVCCRPVSLRFDGFYLPLHGRPFVLPRYVLGILGRCSVMHTNVRCSQRFRSARPCRRPTFVTPTPRDERAPDMMRRLRRARKYSRTATCAGSRNLHVLRVPAAPHGQ